MLYALALVRWREATGAGSLPEIITMLEACLEQTPVGHGYRSRTLQGLAQAWLLHALDIRENPPSAMRFTTQPVWSTSVIPRARRR